MYVLTLDTAMAACSAALSRDGEVLCARHRQLSRGHAEAITPMVAEILAEVGHSGTELDRIGVTVGPGSFTGVRVGIATARALALGTRASVYGITTLQAIAIKCAQAPHTVGAGEMIAVISDARRGEVYIQTFDSAAKQMSDAAVMPPEAVPDWLEAAPLPCRFIGSGIDLVSDSCRAAGLVFQTLPDADPFPDARAFAPFIADLRGAADALPPVPLYLRPPDAKLPQS